MAEAQTVIAYILLLTNWSLGIILVYCCYRFWHQRHETVFIKRRGTIVVAYTISASIVLMVSYPFHLFAFWDFGHGAQPRNSDTDIVVKLCADVVWPPCFQTLAWLFVCRYWLIYYDIQFANSCPNLEWKQCITKNVATLRNETWFMDKRATLGNGAYMFKRAICAAGIVTVLYIICSVLLTLHITELQLRHILNALVFTTMLVFIVIIWRKLPNFNDTIYLWDEMRITAYLWFAGAVVYFSAITIAFIGNSPQLALVRETIIITIGTLQVFVQPFISTFWVLFRIKMANQVEDTNIPRHFVHQHSADQLESVHEMLADMDSLHLLMQHLLQELCMEVMLSLIEFHQFKQVVLIALKEQAMHVEDNVILVDVHITADAPRSDIVYGETELIGTQKYKQIAYKLYQKYIDSGAQFQINLPFDMKQRLDSYMNDYEQWMSESNEVKLDELATLYDQCVLEMMRLLRTAHTRFLCENVGDRSSSHTVP